MGIFFKQTIHDVNLRGLTVLVRVDYNVPLTATGGITSDLRIRASLSTLRYLLEQRCKIVLMSHLGRPKGVDPAYSLRPVARRLAELLGRPVQFIDGCVGDQLRQAVRHMAAGDVLMLENLRFYDEESRDDMVFARAIARAVRPDYFVQDGFAVVHRAHASTHAITLYVPGLAGDLLVHEYTTLTAVMSRPARPLVAIIGGVKIADKIALIERLIDKADTILIGGAMANTFLAYRGHRMGHSTIEPDQEQVLAAIYRRAADKVGEEQVDQFLRLPSDVAVAPSPETVGDRREVSVDEIGEHEMALDIGAETMAQFVSVIASAKTVIWNGPLGYSTNPLFARGSARIAEAIVQNRGVTSIIGGGDTAEFVLGWDGHDGKQFSHISTGGGASLELMSGKKLPGVESLLDAHGLK